MSIIDLDEARRRLAAVFSDLEPGGVIALSGGADSALVLTLAAEIWGTTRVLAVTSSSASIPPEELDVAARIARRAGVEHVILEGRELEVEAFQANASDRCFHCREHLFSRLQTLARERGLPHVLDGANADDLDDHRPGMRAAREHGVTSPLLLAGLTKPWIRELSKALGLETWDKPAQPCLSSRIPYGTRVTLEALGRVGRAERALRDLGFDVVRVRDHDPVGRVEIPAEAFSALLEDGTRQRVLDAVKDAGFQYVALDLAGFRSGSLNEVL